jgi:hypothetical protein
LATPQQQNSSRIRSVPSVALVSKPYAQPIPVIGSSEPIALIAAAGDGSWVAFCQARNDTDADGHIEVHGGPQGELTGDRLENYLVLGAGLGERIDELLAFEPSGRFLAVKRHEQLLLIDSHAKTRTELGHGLADVRSEATPYRWHRSVSFDRTSRRLLYVRATQAGNEVVVRDLESSREKIIDPGPGEVWRAEFDSSGQWIILSVVDEDTNKNGKLEWPVPAAKPDRSQCSGPIPRFSVWLPRGDRPSLRVASAEGGLAEPVPDFVGALGDGLITRTHSSRLIWNKSKLAMASDPQSRNSVSGTFEVAADKCDGRVLYQDPGRNLVIVACAGGGGRWPLWLVGFGFKSDLGIDLAPSDRLQPCEPWPRLLAVYPGKNTELIDLEARTLRPLQSGDLVLCTHRSSALIQRGSELLLFDADTGLTARLAEGVAELPDILLSPPSVLASPLVVDVAERRLIGHIDPRAHPLALTRDGRVLMARANAGPRDFELGPLRWESARP